MARQITKIIEIEAFAHRRAEVTYRLQMRDGSLSREYTEVVHGDEAIDAAFAEAGRPRE